MELYLMQRVESPLLPYEFHRILAVQAPNLNEQSPFSRPSSRFYSQWDRTGFSLRNTARGGSGAVVGKTQRTDSGMLLEFSGQQVDWIHEISMVVLCLMAGILTAAAGFVMAMFWAEEHGLKAEDGMAHYWSSGWAVAMFLLPAIIKILTLYFKKTSANPRLIEEGVKLIEDASLNNRSFEPLSPLDDLGGGRFQFELRMSPGEFVEALRNEQEREARRLGGRQSVRVEPSEEGVRVWESHGRAGAVIVDCRIRKLVDGLYLVSGTHSGQAFGVEKLIDFLRSCSRRDRQEIFPELRT